MYDMTCVLVDEWSKLGPRDTFNPYDEFSKFALDTIAQCAFDLQLNSMRDGKVHQFALAMTYFLSESGKRALRPSFVDKYILLSRSQRYWEAIKEIQALAKEAIVKRRANGKKKNDILNAMLHNPDLMTGKTMTEDNCIHNTLSLLGAGEMNPLKLQDRAYAETGYESVASMLSWTLILLIKNSRCLKKLRHELEEKLSGRRITKEDVDDLPYLTACLREAVRLYPGAYAHNVKLREEAITEGSTGLGEEQYLIRRTDTIRLNLLAIHRDPLIYGDDADKFRPERMMEENFKKLPRNSWKVKFCSVYCELAKI
jgi:cytochrome P450 / NADPH-cytochrome P450 reductase